MTDVDLRVGEGKVVVAVEWPKAQRPACQRCGASCEIHDGAPERLWRHLDTMQFETIIGEQGASRRVQKPFAKLRSRWSSRFSGPRTKPAMQGPLKRELQRSEFDPAAEKKSAPASCPFDLSNRPNTHHALINPINESR